MERGTEPMPERMAPMDHHPIPAQRILVTRMKFIGDVVLTTPLLHSLRQAYPGAHIAYMAAADACSLLEHHPSVDALIPYDFSRPSVLEQPRVAFLLRRSRFDIVLDLFSNPRSAVLTYLSGARVRVGLARAGRGRLYTHQVRDDGTPKTALRFHDQYLRTIGVVPTGTQPLLAVTLAERQEALVRFGVSGGGGPGITDGGRARLVVMHAGATWPSKQWGAEHYAALAVMLARTAGVRVLLTGGPRDGDVLAEVERRSQQAARQAGPLTLRGLAALLAVADAFVGNDGGPMHMAAAVGTPTVGLFGPGEEQIWFPYAGALGHRALREDVPCHPCHLNVCNRAGEGHMECMKRLTPERVLGAVLEALAARPVRPSGARGD